VESNVILWNCEERDTRKSSKCLFYGSIQLQFRLDFGFRSTTAL